MKRLNTDDDDVEEEKEEEEKEEEEEEEEKEGEKRRRKKKEPQTQEEEIAALKVKLGQTEKHVNVLEERLARILGVPLDMSNGQAGSTHTVRFYDGFEPARNILDVLDIQARAPGFDYVYATRDQYYRGRMPQEDKLFKRQYGSDINKIPSLDEITLDKTQRFENTRQASFSEFQSRDKIQCVPYYMLAEQVQKNTRLLHALAEKVGGEEFLQENEDDMELATVPHLRDMAAEGRSEPEFARDTTKGLFGRCFLPNAKETGVASLSIGVAPLTSEQREERRRQRKEKRDKDKKTKKDATLVDKEEEPVVVKTEKKKKKTRQENDEKERVSVASPPPPPKARDIMADIVAGASTSSSSKSVAARKRDNDDDDSDIVVVIEKESKPARRVRSKKPVPHDIIDVDKISDEAMAGFFVGEREEEEQRQRVKETTVRFFPDTLGSGTLPPVFDTAKTMSLSKNLSGLDNAVNNNKKKKNDPAAFESASGFDHLDLFGEESRSILLFDHSSEHNGAERFLF